MVNKSKGLGDSIAKLTKALKIDKVAEAVAKLVGVEGCGCDERKQYLNELFPYEKSSRKFKFLKEFEFGGVKYHKGETISLGRDHDLFQVVINLVRDEILKEL